MPNDFNKLIFSSWKSISKNNLRRSRWRRRRSIFIEYGQWSRWIQNFRDGRGRKKIRNLKEKRAWAKEKRIVRISRKKEKIRSCKQSNSVSSCQKINGWDGKNIKATTRKKRQGDNGCIENRLKKWKENNRHIWRPFSDESLLPSYCSISRKYRARWASGL